MDDASIMQPLLQRVKLLFTVRRAAHIHAYSHISTRNQHTVKKSFTPLLTRTESDFHVISFFLVVFNILKY